MTSLFSFQTLFLALAASLAFVALKIVYRLYFHPLRNFPGPKLAAATSLYAAYYDICTPGLIKRLPELHKKYGPLVRIMPNELHASSLEDYNQYVSSDCACHVPPPGYEAAVESQPNLQVLTLWPHRSSKLFPRGCH